MILQILISFLVLLLIFRFLFLGRTSARFKISITNFNNKHPEPLIIQKEKASLIVVMNPVGDRRIGEAACRIAGEIITKHSQTEIANPIEFLKKACFLAHRGISEQMNANSGGCSIAIVYVSGKQLNYASVGDIGVYLFDDEIKQLNQFDLYKYQLRGQVLERKISEERLLNNQLRNELTAYLGHENLKKVHLSNLPIQLLRSNKLLIATKDIYEVITPLTLESIILKRGKPVGKINLLEATYQQLKQAKEKRPSTASAVIMSHFK